MEPWQVGILGKENLGRFIWLNYFLLSYWDKGLVGFSCQNKLFSEIFKHLIKKVNLREDPVVRTRQFPFIWLDFPPPKKPVQISQFWGKENSHYPQTYGSFIFARQPQIPSCVTSHKEMVPLCMLLPNPVRVVCVYVCVRACICKLLFPIKFGWVRKLFFSCHFRLQISRVK